MKSQPAERGSNTDLLVMSQVLSNLRDLLVELSLALQDERFHLEVELRDEANRQLQDVLDQIRRRQSGPSNDSQNNENLNSPS